MHGSTGGGWKRNASASPRQLPTQPTSDTDESHDSSKTLRAMGSVDAPMDPRVSICKDLPPVQLPARAEPVGRHTLTPSPSPARAPADPNRAEQLLGAIQQGALRPTLRNGRRSQPQPARPPPR